MKKFISMIILVLLSVMAVPSVVAAAKAPAPSVTEQVGYDVSYPQCGRTLPTNQSFGIVGVNGGTAATENSCLADQLVWASKSKVGSKQPSVQLYVNTANPGEVISQITTWPSTSADSNSFTPINPYGTCTGANDTACSWLYGWNRSIYTERVFKFAASSKGLNTNTTDYMWWLDVETMNTWQSVDAYAPARNVAAIEGFGAYYASKGAPIGLYSTATQWSQITGNNLRADSNLNGLPNWRPSGATLSNAKSNCSIPPLTVGGKIVLTQYVVKNLDYNHSCI